MSQPIEELLRQLVSDGITETTLVITVDEFGQVSVTVNEQVYDVRGNEFL